MESDTSKLKILYKYYPSDVLVTGFDIIFFWVARMMMLGMEFLNKEPFKEIYVHALVRDEKGQKMSKSKGNVIDPLSLIESYSADALRFTLLSMASPGRDVKLSEQRVKGYRNFLTKIWNVNNFLKVNKCNFDGEIEPKSEKIQPDAKENHNVKIPNRKEKYASIYNGDDWGDYDIQETDNGTFIVTLPNTGFKVEVKLLRGSEEKEIFKSYTRSRRRGKKSNFSWRKIFNRCWWRWWRWRSRRHIYSRN